MLEHVAAVLIFSGPFFWVGLWMLIDPACVAMVPSWFAKVFKIALERVGGFSSKRTVEQRHDGISRRTRMTLRVAGLVLVLFAIVV